MLTSPCWNIQTLKGTTYWPGQLQNYGLLKVARKSTTMARKVRKARKGTTISTLMGHGLELVVITTF